MLKILIEAFKKSKGRMPNAIEMLQLKFKAAQQSGKGKVIEFPKDKITDWRKPRPTEGESAGITSIDKKAQTIKTIDEDKFVADFMANADRVYYRFVSDTLAKVQNASKGEQLKIAKDIINRKGIYHSLDEKDATKILKSIDQNIKPVEPKAGGGIAGMLGEPTYEDGGRARYQTGAMVDPRMQQSYAQNVAAQATQRAANYAARFGDTSQQNLVDKFVNQPSILGPAAQQAAKNKLEGIQKSDAALDMLNQTSMSPTGTGDTGIMTQASTTDTTRPTMADVAGPTTYDTWNKYPPGTTGYIGPYGDSSRDPATDKYYTYIPEHWSTSWKEYPDQRDFSLYDKAGAMDATFNQFAPLLFRGESGYPETTWSERPLSLAQLQEFKKELDQLQNIRGDIPSRYYDKINEAINAATLNQGGRVGFKDGYSPKRRQFLKLAAGLATIPLIGKYFKWAKPLAKTSKVADLTSVPIGSAKGMPAWFKPLVNKVIKEGDDVTKKFATKEREIVHTKKLDEFEEVTVHQDLDTGNVRVDYHGTNNMGDGPIQLDYRASQEIPLKGKKGSTKTKEEFSAVESEPEIVNWDGDMEWSGENVVSKVDDLLTDTTKLETYATGKNPNIKKLLKSEKKKKHVNKLNEDQMEQLEYIENKSGHLAPERLLDEPIPDDFASGGRVPLAGGKEVLKGLAWLANKIAPKSTKIGQTSKTMAPKTQLKRAIAGFQEREAAKKLKVWNDPDKVRAAVDDIFSSGDYKMDAEMAAEALVENNPKAFGGKLIDDLDDATRSEIYGAVLRVVQSDLAKTLQLKRLSKPTKTLEGIKKTGTINISDPNVADEFTRFMKEVDPKGHKKLEQTVDLMNLDPKGKKGHASGGRVSLSAGGLAGMLGE